MPALPAQTPAQSDMIALYLADRDPTTSMPIKFLWASVSDDYLSTGSGSYRCVVDCFL